MNKRVYLKGSMQSEVHLSGQIIVQTLLYKDGIVGKN